MPNDFLMLLIQGLAGGAVVSVVVAGLRKVIPKIPRVGLLVLLVVVSAGGDYVSTLATGQNMSPLLVTLYTTLGLYLREFKSTVQEHGLNG